MGHDSPTSLSIPLHHSQKKDTSPSIAGFFGKSGYKLWVLTAILLLAFCSMFTGSVSLKWSYGNLISHHSDDVSLHQDLDVLELEEREKVVRKMWDVYTHSTTSVRLPRFWLQAFEAAYENLSSDVAQLRDNAISEIAKLSIRSLHLDDSPSTPPSKSSSQGRKMSSSKQAGKKKD